MKRKGLIFQYQLVLLFLMIAMLMAGGFFFRSISLDREKIARLHEMEAIQLALTKYADDHTGVVPVDGQDTLKFSAITKDYGDPYGEVENSKFLYEKPGLFPKDLYELCELGYLPASFRGTLREYKDKNYSPVDTSGTEEPKKYGDKNGYYLYEVSTYDGSNTENDHYTKQYTYYKLSYVSPKFTIPAKEFGVKKKKG